MSRYALCVGIDDYPTAPLTSCVADAVAVANILLEPTTYDFVVEILRNEEATTDAIRKAVELTLSQGTECAVIYFAGHGINLPYGPFFCSHGTDASPQSGFDLHLLQRMIQSQSIPNSAVVLLLDFCQSGAVNIGNGNANTFVSPTHLTYVAQTFSDRRVLLAACRDTEYAAENTTLGHGLFTQALIEALGGEAADQLGNVTVTSLFDYIDRSFRVSKHQQPVFKGDIAGQVVLGSGLRTRDQHERDERVEEMVTQAHAHANTLHSFVTQCIVDTVNWQRTGHQAACRTAEPILKWYEKRRRESQAVDEHPQFRVSLQKVIEDTRFLSNISTGLIVNDAQVGQRLGSGSFGTVWELMSPNGRLAMKSFHSQELHLNQKAKRFENGFYAMKQLSHPHIVRVHSFLTCPLGFTMDFIEGANLRDWAYAGNDPAQVLQILLTICDTLRHAHALGVIHRDVKPENVIMKPDPTGQRWLPYLTDFDLAWFSTASLLTTEALGTVFYAAPEQLGKPGSAAAHSKAVDIYSFGQLMFYVITGQDPKPLGLAENLVPLRSTLGTWISHDPALRLQRLYEACSERNPQDRPRTMSEVADELSRILLEVGQFEAGRILSVSEFSTELRFSMVGLSEREGVDEFRSLSGQSGIHCSSLGTDGITVTVHSLRPTLGVGTDWRSAREALNERVDTAIRSYGSFVRRRNGRLQPYEVLLEFPRVTWQLEGVTAVREVLGRVIDKLESV